MNNVLGVLVGYSELLMLEAEAGSPFLDHASNILKAGQRASAIIQDLLVLDMIMDPGIDGLETYKRILEIHPRQKAIIVSGFSESVRVRQAQLIGAGAYVRKPYLRETLGRAVRLELDRKD